MNPETKSADALARELAERCADKLKEAFEIGGASTFCDEIEFDSADSEDISKIIIKAAKLRELCTCAEALRGMVEWYGGMANSADMEEGATQAVRSAEEALAALDGGGK